MKRRNPESERALAGAAVSSSSRSPADAELAEARLALGEALEKIDAEVERRQKAEQEFEHLVATEREHLRKQLHDGLGQALTSVSFLACGLRARLRTSGLSDAPELDEIISLINQAVAESRALAAGINQKPCARATYSPAL